MLSQKNQATDSFFLLQISPGQPENYMLEITQVIKRIGSLLYILP